MRDACRRVGFLCERIDRCHPAGHVGRMIAMAIYVSAIWVVHGLRHPAFREPDPTATLKDGGWEAYAGHDAVGRGIGFARAHRLLPEAWLFGLQYTAANAGERRAYAAGRYSTAGWWWYFPFTVAIK